VKTWLAVDDFHYNLRAERSQFRFDWNHWDWSHACARVPMLRS